MLVSCFSLPSPFNPTPSYRDSWPLPSWKSPPVSTSAFSLNHPVFSFFSARLCLPSFCTPNWLHYKERACVFACATSFYLFWTHNLHPNYSHLVSFFFSHEIKKRLNFFMLCIAQIKQTSANYQQITTRKGGKCANLKLKPLQAPLGFRLLSLNFVSGTLWG